jgi:putative membrane protein
MPNVKISRSAGLSTSTASNSRLFTLDDASKAPTEYSLYGLSEDVKHISYGENSRQYRRTVYTHDDWVRHRRSGRFAHNLKTMWTSGVYKSLFNQVLATTGMATLAVLWNALVPRCFRKLPNLSLPMTPFTLLAPSLGLLLVFRTNTSYGRWDEARKNWGLNINRTRDLVRMGTSFYDSRGVTPEQRQKDLDALALATWAFVRAMKRHLSSDMDEEDFRKELLEKLPTAQAGKIIAATHRPNRALFDLSLAIENLPMHFLRKNEVHKSVTVFEDTLGGSERLLSSPVPLFYSRHTARFLSLWLLFLPFALWESFKGTWHNVGLIPTTALVSLLLFGIDELATQLEEPFSILPMQGFCDKIYNCCFEIVSWKKGDNGMPVTHAEGSHTGKRPADEAHQWLEDHMALDA